MISDCHITDCDKSINDTSLPKAVLFFFPSFIVGEIGESGIDRNHSANAVQGKIYRHFMAMSIQGNKILNHHDCGVDRIHSTHIS